MYTSVVMASSERGRRNSVGQWEIRRGSLKRGPTKCVYTKANNLQKDAIVNQKGCYWRSETQPWKFEDVSFVAATATLRQVGVAEANTGNSGGGGRRRPILRVCLLLTFHSVIYTRWAVLLFVQCSIPLAYKMMRIGYNKVVAILFGWPLKASLFRAVVYKQVNGKRIESASLSFSLGRGHSLLLYTPQTCWGILCYGVATRRESGALALVFYFIFFFFHLLSRPHFVGMVTTIMSQQGATNHSVICYELK